MRVEVNPRESFLCEIRGNIRVIGEFIIAEGFNGIGSPMFMIIDDVDDAHTTYHDLVDFPTTINAIADFPGRCHHAIVPPRV